MITALIDKFYEPATLRWLRPARRTLWLLLLAWALWSTTSRWDMTPTLGPSELSNRLEPDWQRYQRLRETLAGVPAFQTQASGGSIPWGRSALRITLRGEWNPRQQPAIRDAVGYFQRDNVNVRLDALVALSREIDDWPAGPEVRLVADRQRRVGGPPADIADATYDDAIAALTARARYRVNEQGDLAGALADLRAAVRLVRHIGMHRSQTAYWYWNDPMREHLPLSEVQYLVQEHPVPPALAAEMITFLRTPDPAAVGTEWLRNAGLSDNIDLLLDPYYTDDGNGHGELVVSHAAELLDPGLHDRLLWAWPHSGFWNVFAPIYNDRATVRAKLERWRAAARAVDNVPAVDAAEILREAGVPAAAHQALPLALDGPLTALPINASITSYASIVDISARRQALVVMFALAAYRHDHGRYPDTLDAITPEYLVTVPPDIRGGEPFTYQVVSDDRYWLKCDTDTDQLWHYRYSPPEGINTTYGYAIERP